MPVWESEKVLERKPLFRSLQSISTGGWVFPLRSSPLNEPKKIRLLKLSKNHRSASPILTYFKELKGYCYSNLRKTKLVQLPPKAKEFESTTFTSTSRDRSGT